MDDSGALTSPPDDVSGMDIWPLPLAVTTIHHDPDFVHTEHLEEATDILQDKGRVVLCGPPGSGKTTLAHAVLRWCQDQGFAPYTFTDVKEWQTYVSQGRRSAVLMDGTLGEVRVDRQQYRQWRATLCTLLQLTSQGTCRLVLTLYPHVLRELRELEGELNSPLVDSVVVVQLSNTGLSRQVKEQMLHCHLRHVCPHPDERHAVVQTVLRKDQSGAVFPWCCRRLAEYWHVMSDPGAVFTAPAEAHVPLLKRLFHDAQHGNTFAAVMALTMKGMGGFLHDPRRVGPELSELRLQDCSEYRLAEYADVLKGSVLGEDGYGFTCRVLYDAVGLALGRSFPLPILLKVCDIKFLVTHVRTEPVPASTCTVNVGANVDVREIFLQRVYEHVSQGGLADLVQHPSFASPEFLKELEQFCSKGKNNLMRFVTAVDSVHGLPLLYWSTWNPSPNLTQWCQKLINRPFFKKMPPDNVLSSALMCVLFTESADGFIGKGKVFLEALMKIIRVDLLLNDSTPVTVVFPFPTRRFTDGAERMYQQLAKHVESHTLPMSITLPTVTMTDNSVSVEMTKKGWCLMVLLACSQAGHTDEQGNTSLHAAAAAGSKEAIRMLINSGSSMTARNQQSLTPSQVAERRWGKSRTGVWDYKPIDLHKAIKEGEAEEVKELLCSCATVHDRLNFSTPLHSAASAGQEQLASLLVQLGADVNAKMFFNNDTPLHEPCRAGNVGMVRVLLHHRALVNECGLGGYTPLHCACVSGHVDVVELLVDGGADVNARTRDDKSTALHLACTHGRADIVRILLSHHADARKKNKDGLTPIDVARKKRLHEVVELMVSPLE